MKYKVIVDDRYYGMMDSVNTVNTIDEVKKCIKNGIKKCSNFGYKFDYFIYSKTFGKCFDTEYGDFNEKPDKEKTYKRLFERAFERLDEINAVRFSAVFNKPAYAVLMFIVEKIEESD